MSRYDNEHKDRLYDDVYYACCDAVENAISFDKMLEIVFEALRNAILDLHLSDKKED